MASRRCGGSRGSSSGLRHELLDLSHHLRQERLYVQSEKVQLQELNEKVKSTAENLSHTAWLAHRQRENLENLIFAPRGTSSSSDCLPAIPCLRANLLDQTSFQDAYKHLSHQEMIYSDFLLALRNKPKILATFLTLADRSGYEKMNSIVSTLFSGLYGSCLLIEDEKLLLRLLYHLMKSQLSTSTNPRKLLRQGNCAFSRLYKAFSGELFSAKLFLTSALHDPILKLLSDDEVFLDVDPAKMMVRFPMQEREKKFGKENSSDYAQKLKQHREFICQKLEVLTNNFIEGIKQNVHCFPLSLARLLKAMYNMLMAKKVEPRLVNAVCVDVLFSSFICPAIVDPNPVGIIDTPISYIARSNLMQIAQILQVLALWKWEEIDPRLSDLYSRFDKDALSSVLEAMLDPAADAYLLVNNGASDDEDLDLQLTYFDDGIANSDLDSFGLNPSTTGLNRLAVLLTRNELEDLIAMLRSLQGNADLSELETNELMSFLEPLPDKVPMDPALKFKESKNTKQSTPNPGCKEDNSPLAAMIAKRQVLSNRLSTAVNAAVKRSGSLTASTPSTPGSDDLPTSDIISPVQPNHINDDSMETLDESALLQQCEAETVLVVPLPDRQLMSEPPGFLSEEHVISRSRQTSRVVRMNLANLPGGDGEEVENEAEAVQENLRRNSHGNATLNSEENSSLVSMGQGEKRTRFSLSHDEGSIGNTSDNLEAISEAASNHSVASSLEDEPDNPDAEDPIIDNLSDMVSANVSGRGTPNVSGRDTPSSQVTEDGGDDSQNRQPRNDVDDGGIDNVDHQHPQIEIGPEVNVPAAEEVPHVGGRLQRGVHRKPGEPDLDEKFGKFDIKSSRTLRSGVPNVAGHPTGQVIEQGDETISMVSDTWSTDVLASDTETTLGDAEDRILRRQRARLPDDLPLVDRQLSMGTASAQATGGASSVASSSAANLLDVAETGSEAWSIDVLASDTESLRLAELDNEDSGSVAQSDDTTRSDPPELLLGLDGASSGLKTRRVLPENTGLRPSRAAAVEQWARQSSGHAPRLSAASANAIQRRGSDSLGISRPTIEGSILKKPQIIPEGSDETSAVEAGSASSNIGVVNVNNSARILSHASAASIASSTESSAEDSGSGLAATASKEAVATMVVARTTTTTTNTKTPAIDLGEIEVAAAAVASSSSSSSTTALTSSSNGIASTTSTASGTISTINSQQPNIKKSTLMSNTGAIPKSISFDKAVVMKEEANSASSPAASNGGHQSTSFESDSRDVSNISMDNSNTSSHHLKSSHNNNSKHRMDKSFFKSWKLPKIGKSSSGRGGGGHSMNKSANNNTSNHVDLLMTSEDQVLLTSQEDILAPTRDNEDTTEEILNKYRSKPITRNSNNTEQLSNSSEVILTGAVAGSTTFNSSNAKNETSEDMVDGLEELVDDRLIIDPHNVEASFAFQDAKRKLRMMLSEADMSIPSTSIVARDSKASNEIVALLRMQLAEAHNLGDRNMVAQLHETLRCLSLFDNEACRKLVRSLKEDYKRRSPYLAYLVKCRQGLLATLAHQKRLLLRMEADRTVCSSHQISVCVRLFLEKREKLLLNFVNHFRDSCSALDEKIALMERFLASLWSQLEADTSVMLLTVQHASQMEMFKLAVERAVVSHIYHHAMYPNGEADISRDSVLAEHISKLSVELTPNHRYLKISSHFHYEAPWPSAQAELKQLAAFKTPKDKVACVVRCCQTIMNLLSLSAKNSVPAADDFLPVLVFVLVKANPPSLLSTVQYVESFYGNRLGGEDQYWWMQLVAGVEFIKTMDYN